MAAVAMREVEFGKAGFLPDTTIASPQSVSHDRADATAERTLPDRSTCACGGRSGPIAVSLHSLIKRLPGLELFFQICLISDQGSAIDEWDGREIYHQIGQNDHKLILDSLPTDDAGCRDGAHRSLHRREVIQE